MKKGSELLHTGQAPARRPPQDSPDIRGEGELDPPGEGHIDVPPQKSKKRSVIEKQLSLPGVEDVPARRGTQRP